MKSTISTKYQIVIPKAARKRFVVKPGQELQIQSVSDKQITFGIKLTAKEFLDEYSGNLKGAAWQKDTIDATEWLREYRNKDSASA